MLVGASGIGSKNFCTSIKNIQNFDKNLTKLNFSALITKTCDEIKLSASRFAWDGNLINLIVQPDL